MVHSIKDTHLITNIINFQLVFIHFQDELSKPFGLQKTASQHLKELFEQQKSQANISDSENDQLESTKQS